MRWLAESRYLGLGYIVILAKDVLPRELALRLEIDMNDFSPMTWREGKRIEFADRSQDYQAIRFIGSFGWSFAIAEYGPVAVDAYDAALAASRDTIAMSFYRTSNQDSLFTLAMDGVEICSFDPATPGDRVGQDPEYLLQELEALGLVQSHKELALPQDFAESAILELIETKFEVRLSEEKMFSVPQLTGKIPY